MASTFVFYVCAFGLYIPIEVRCYRNAVPPPTGAREVIRLQHLNSDPINYAKTDQLLTGGNRDVLYKLNRVDDGPVKVNNGINYAKDDQVLPGKNGDVLYKINRVDEGPAPDVAYDIRRGGRLVPNWGRIINQRLDKMSMDRLGLFGSLGSIEHLRSNEILRSSGPLRTESNAEAVEEDFSLLLQKMKADSTRKTTTQQDATTHVSKLVNIIDETDVMNALKNDPLIRRILAHALAKRQTFFKQMKENGIMAYDSFQRRYPVYK